MAKIAVVLVVAVLVCGYSLGSAGGRAITTMTSALAR